MKSQFPGFDTYVDEIDECVANAVQQVSYRSLFSYFVLKTYLQSFAKSMRRYMKSYLPQLDSSTILFNIA